DSLESPPMAVSFPDWPMSCRSGFHPFNGICLGPYTPTLSVSSPYVPPGGAVEVGWNGGTHAGTCLMTLTNAFQVDYAPQVANIAGVQDNAGIGSDTTYKLTCPNNIDGTYLSVRPEITTHVLPGLDGYLTRLQSLGLARAESWR